MLNAAAADASTPACALRRRLFGAVGVPWFIWMFPLSYGSSRPPGVCPTIVGLSPAAAGPRCLQVLSGIRAFGKLPGQLTLPPRDVGTAVSPSGTQLGSPVRGRYIEIRATKTDHLAHGSEPGSQADSREPALNQARTVAGTLLLAGICGYIRSDSLSPGLVLPGLRRSLADDRPGGAFWGSSARQNSASFGRWPDGPAGEHRLRRIREQTPSPEPRFGRSHLPTSSVQLRRPPLADHAGL